MERGYIKLWRAVTDSEFYFTEKFTKSAAWMDLLLLANFQQRSVEVRGILVELKPGQVLASDKFLAERWKWSREKVRNYLALISSKTRQQIIWKKSNVCSVVEIVNWPLYQQDRATNQTAEKHQTGQQKNTPKNVENVENVKKREYKPPQGGASCDFLKLFNEITGRKFRILDEKAKRQFNARKREGFTESDFSKAIKNCMDDDYHRDNPKYLTPEFITRSDKLQKYLNAIQPSGKVTYPDCPAGMVPYEFGGTFKRQGNAADEAAFRKAVC